MAIAYKLKTDKMSGKLEKGVREYTREYTITTTAGESYPTILAAAPIAPGGPHPDDSSALLVSFTIDERELSKPTARVYAGNFQFSTEIPITTEPNPLDRDPVVKVDFAKENTLLDVDFAGNPVINSAEESFENLPEIPCSRMKITIEQNFASFDLDDANDLVDSVNDDDMVLPTPDGGTWTLPQYAGRMEGVSINPKKENNVDFVEVNFSILVNKDLWHPLTLVDMGFNFVNDDGKHLAFVTDDWQPKSKASRLDGAGSADSWTGNSTTEYLEFQAYRLVDWSIMGI